MNWMTERRSRLRRGRRPSPSSVWRTLAGLVLRTAVLALVTAVALVATLRFVDPPTTAYMLAAGIAARRDGEPLPRQHWVEDACLPDSARLAVIAAEDQRFASHRGFDFGQIEAALAEARDGGRMRGASTISQQTARNLFLWSGGGWVRKGLEAGFTVLVEILWPKQRILEVYLNVAEFGPGVYGVGAAAAHFFDGQAAALSASQSALLAAVLPSPRRYDAAAPGDYLRARRRWILGQMGRVRSLPGMSAVLQRGAPPARCGG